MIKRRKRNLKRKGKRKTKRKAIRVRIRRKERRVTHRRHLHLLAVKILIKTRSLRKWS